MIEEALIEESGYRLGYIILTVAAVGFICSLTYNHGYFWHLNAGIRILSIGDILTSYSLWVPGLATLLFGAMLDLLLQHMQNEEANKLKKHKRLIRSILGLPHILLLIGLIILMFLYLVKNYELRPIVIWFSLSYIWVSFSSLLFTVNAFKTHKSKLTLGLCIFVPVVLSLTFTLGLDKFIIDRNLHIPNANLFLSNHEDRPHPIIILRHLERGLLTKQVANKHLQLYLWEDISSVEILS